tara:strand:- start:236 stop:670 length:435 start_codon:yes stop_codon:yes gene_type:complete
MKLDYKKITSLIPHRPPFLFVDECEIIDKGKKGIAYKTFNEDEYFFEGHFPNNPIVPGVIIIEALAQTAGIVVSENLEENKEKSVLFMSISKAKFRKPILPNNKICLEVKFVNSVKNVYKFYGIASINGSICSEVEFSAMVTYK